MFQGIVLVMASAGAIAETTQPENVESESASDDIDMSDPMAIYTNAGLSFGTGGIDMKLGLQIPSDGGFSNMIILEGKGAFRKGESEEFASYRGRYFAGQQEGSLRFAVDVNYNAEADVALYNTGVFYTQPISSNLTIYPGMMVGKATNGGTVAPGTEESTTIMTAMFYSRYTLSDKTWLTVNPTYTHYREEFGDVGRNNFSMEMGIGYQLNKKTNVRLWGGTDNEMKLQINRAF